MPLGVKGSGKAKAAANATALDATTTKRPYHRKDKATEAPVVLAPVAAAPTDKPRKPYPSAAERIAMADQQIERLTALRSSRETLVAKTEAILAERQKALASCTTALEKALSRKEHLITAQSKAPKVSLHSKPAKKVCRIPTHLACSKKRHTA